jgi:hypothetical protein
MNFIYTHIYIKLSLSFYSKPNKKFALLLGLHTFTLLHCYQEFQIPSVVRRSALPVPQTADGSFPAIVPKL